MNLDEAKKRHPAFAGRQNVYDRIERDHVMHVIRDHTEECGRCGDRVVEAYTRNNHGLAFDLVQAHTHPKDFFCHIEDGRCMGVLFVGWGLPRHKCEEVL